MSRNKPLKYLVLLGVEELDATMLLRLAERLEHAVCFLGPENATWANQYFEEVGVFILASWNTHVHHCLASRIKPPPFSQ